MRPSLSLATLDQSHIPELILDRQTSATPTMGEGPAVTSEGSYRHRWTVILAGGEGVRLRPVTKLIAGDDRPKQFCRLLGDSTLLARTRERLQHVVPRGQSAMILSKGHERYFAEDAADVEASRLFVQPMNKGTTAAIAFGLLRLMHLDQDATVGFFPADHDFDDPRQFTLAVESAYEEAENRRERIVVVGVPATRADVDYGWIDPGPSLGNPERQFCKVTRFWVKPPIETAKCLFEQGCLWNTFVMVGRIRAFLNALALTAPQVLEQLCPVSANPYGLVPDGQLADIFRSLHPGDFVRQVLTASTERLAVLRLKGSGWIELGTPPQLFAARRRNPAYQDSQR